MMEERKFVCKYCSKRFPCGKSLGGHIRTHMTEERNNAENNNNNNNNSDDHNHLKLLDSGRKRKRERDSSWPEPGSGAAAAAAAGNNNNPIYGLRENPKKTTRFVHIDATLAQEDERFCKECGKGFPSLKALCGHMACHSEKEKGINNNNNNNNTEDQKLVMDSQSDTESSGAPTHPRRSKRMRFKTVNLSNQPSAPLPNGSSSVSEVEQEQEEVARMLIMLSRDYSHKVRFASVAESSDNNSVVLETAKSSSPDETRVAAKGLVSSNAYGVVLQKKQANDIKFKCADNSGSAHVRYGLKTKLVESDVPNSDEFNSNKGWNVRDKSGFGDYDVGESKKVLSKGRSKYTEAAANKDLDYDRTDGTARKFEFRKRASNYDSLGGHNSANGSTKKTANGFTNDEIYENGRKPWKYESLASEYDGSYDSTEEESDKNSTDTDSFPAPKSRNNKATNGKKSSKAKKLLKSKKSREHECPICYRIFRSGQALGGHKRSHFIGGSEENTLVIKQGAPAVPCLIDLNLPAPIDD